MLRTHICLLQRKSETSKSKKLQLARQPVQSLKQTFTSGGTGWLYEPVTLLQVVETELVSHLGSVHGIWQVLLVGKYQDDALSQLIVAQHLLKFVSGLADTLSIVGIDNKDDSVGVCVVMSPQWTNLVLTSDVPHGKVHLLVLDGFNVEANGWDRCHVFIELQLV